MQSWKGKDVRGCRCLCIGYGTPYPQWPQTHREILMSCPLRISESLDQVSQFLPGRMRIKLIMQGPHQRVFCTPKYRVHATSLTCPQGHINPYAAGIQYIQQPFTGILQCHLYTTDDTLSLMLLVANLANTKWCTKPENDRNPGTWVLIWECSARAFKWIPTWQSLDGFQKSLRHCALDESSLSIGRVNNCWIRVIFVKYLLEKCRPKQKLREELAWLKTTRSRANLGYRP